MKLIPLNSEAYPLTNIKILDWNNSERYKPIFVVVKQTPYQIAMKKRETYFDLSELPESNTQMTP
jgi:uncharacterized protein YfbU (UPF0304 family)